MAVVIVATAGASTANSFVTLAEMTTYMESRLNGALWTAAATDDQNRALVESTREINNRSWEGSRTDGTQALSWPRDWASDPDSPTATYYATTVVPQRVKDATMELAFQFIKSGTTDVVALDASTNVISETVDVISVDYLPYGRAKGLARYPRVMDLLRPLLAYSGLTTAVIRG